MPTYQYACTECDHAFEQVQSFTDDALTVCPACEGRLRKVYGAVGVVFKGSGFYRNDSRSTTTSSEGPGSSDAGSKDAAKGKDAAKDSGSSTQDSGSKGSGSSSGSKDSGSSSGSSSSSSSSSGSSGSSASKASSPA